MSIKPPFFIPGSYQTTRFWFLPYKIRKRLQYQKSNKRMLICTIIYRMLDYQGTRAGVQLFRIPCYFSLMAKGQEMHTCSSCYETSVISITYPAFFDCEGEVRILVSVQIPVLSFNMGHAATQLKAYIPVPIKCVWVTSRTSSVPSSS